MEMPSSCVLVMRKFDMPTVRTIEYEAMEVGCTFTVVRTSATDSTQTLELTVIGSCAAAEFWDGTACITCEAPGTWEPSVSRCIGPATGEELTINVLQDVFEYKETVKVGDRVKFVEERAAGTTDWHWTNPQEEMAAAGCV
jgi:hypothetical protein